VYILNGKNDPTNRKRSFTSLFIEDFQMRFSYINCILGDAHDLKLFFSILHF
jgi:hypothetical protein